jgi:chemotaxis protein methyltransferase CheR
MNWKIDDVIKVFKDKYNIDLSVYDESFLFKSIGKRTTSENIYSDYSVYLLNNHAEAHNFHESLNITYSEFFRNQMTFALLEQVVLPAIIESKKKNGGSEIRVWSTACAGGQEAYSIAILLDELISMRGIDINYRIFATDISETELEKAENGSYEISSLQQMRIKHLNKYFTQNGDIYRIADYLKEKINFSVYDLLDNSSSCPSMSIYGDFDLIFCGNILFYYRPDIRQRILNKVYYCMSPNGYLATGEAEREIVAKSDLFYAVLPAATIFKRRKY